MTRHEDITIPGEIKLTGTLSIPANVTMQLPAVLFIAGSGAGDRNGNVANFKLDTFKILSTLFLEHGYITLRYDKRGVGNSEGNYYASGLTDFINDAVSATRYLKSLDLVDEKQVIIIGHSEGAILAPAVYYAQEPVSRLILLCGSASPGWEIMPLPGEKLINEIKNTLGVKGVLFKLFLFDKIAKILWDYINNKALNSSKPIIKILGVKNFNAKWLRESYQFDVRPYLQKVKCPTLIIAGDKDIQSDPTDAEKIAKLIPGEAHATIIANMNHILCHYETEYHLLSCIKEYKTSLKNGLSHEFLRELSQWLPLNHN